MLSADEYHRPVSPTLQDFKAELFRALAHPTRIRIVELLREHRRMTVGEVQQALHIAAATTSQHLAVLRGHALIVATKEGANVWYEVRDPDLYRLLDVARSLFETRLEAQAQLLESGAEERR